MSTERGVHSLLAPALLLFGLVFVVALVIVSAVGYQAQVQTVRAHGASVSQYEARLLAAQVRSDLEGADGVLRTTVRTAERHLLDEELLVERSRLDEVILPELLLSDVVSGTAVVSRDGEMLWQSPSFSLDSAQARQLAAPLLDSVTSFRFSMEEQPGSTSFVLVLARRIPSGLGNATGVALATLRAVDLLRLDAETSTDYPVNLVLSDGSGQTLSARCRSSDVPCEPGHPPGEQTLALSVFSDAGTGWEATSYRVEWVPLWVTATADLSELLDSFVSRNRQLLVMFAALAALIVVLAVATQRQRASFREIRARHVEEIEDSNRQLQKLIEERELLVREVHHRVKNNLALIESILTMTAEDGPESARAPLHDVSARIAAISGVHDALYQSEELTRFISADSYLAQLIRRLVSTLAAFPISLNIDIEPIAFSSRAAIPIGIMTAEITTNAIKYGLVPGATYSVSLHRDGSDLVIRYRNTGEPYPEHPSPGLGTELVEQLAQQMGGSSEVQTGDGTTVILRLPLDRCTETDRGSNSG